VIGAYNWKLGRSFTVYGGSAPLRSPGYRICVHSPPFTAPASGRLLVGPAEIMHDVLANVCAMPLPWSRFDRFRAQTASQVLGGVLDAANKTVRATLDDLLMSVDAAWSTGAEEVALRYPWPEADEAVAFVASPLSMREVVAEYSHAQIVTALRQYGKIEREWDAAWLRSASACWPSCAGCAGSSQDGRR
jgi:hypothetical protein